MKFLISAILLCVATCAWAAPGQLVYEEECHVFEVYSDYPFYHFGQGLGIPFYQEAGNIYWISIQGVYAVDSSWYWEMCVPEDNWGFEGHFRSEYFGVPDWTPISEATGVYMDLAFVLYGASGAEKWRQNPSEENGIHSTCSPSIVSEAADDFFCEDGDPIIQIEWWGWFSSPVPDYFMIRFYLDDSTTAIQESTWSVLKQLY